MPKYLAEVEFTFESESDAVGAALRRLRLAAQDAGFDLKRGKAVPAPPPRTRTRPEGRVTFH